MATYAPRHVDIWPWTEAKSAVGSLVRYNGSTMLGMGVMTNDGSLALNDEMVWGVALDAGTWTLTVIGWALGDRGIVTWSLDGTSLGTQDWYLAGLGTRNTVKQIAGITVATPGVYDLKAKVTDINASSAGYGFAWQLITLTRTGA